MELYAAVRRSVYVEGWSERAAARRFGLARETVRKMLRYRLPPGYRRQKPIRCPKLEAFTGVIDQILRDDQHRPKKQRHTAKRICERLRAEHDFTGGYTIVKAYVREQKLGGQEMFVPLAHPPGDAQADFGEALVVIDGVERKAHYLVVDLPHSDDAFVKAFPAETTEAFCDGHNAAFHYFGGVPRRIVYDNTKLAVSRMLALVHNSRSRSIIGVYPGFPTIFRGLSEFFVGDLMGKALWKLVENAQRFPRRGGRVLCVHGPSASTGLVRVRQNGPRGGGLRTGPPASSDCGRPVNDKCSHQHRRSVQAERSSYPGKTVISGTYAIWETRI